MQLNLIHEIENFNETDLNFSFTEKFPDFSNALDYKNIAKKYLQIFEKIQKS